MNKKIVILALIFLTLVGSIVAFYGFNALAADILNIAAITRHSTVFATIPPLALGALIVMGVLYVIRLYKKPTIIKRLSRTYLIIAASLSFVSLVASILCGTVVYHSFTSPHPFKGFTIISLLLSILFLAASLVVLFVFVRKLPEDTERVKVDYKHVLKTIGWVFFISLAFNRFGALLNAPIYIYLRDLNRSFPFYLYLLVPMYILVIKALMILDIINGKKKEIIYLSVGIGLNLVLAGAYMIIGLLDNGVVSSISPALPLERISSMPIESIIHVLTCFGVLIPQLVISIKKER